MGEWQGEHHHDSDRYKVQDFGRRAEEVGLLKAASEYGVELELRDILQLASDLRKDEPISVDDCRVGLSIASALRHMEVDLNEFEKFAEDFFQASRNQNLSGTDLAAALAEYTIIRNENESTYREITNDYETKKNELQNLNGELARMREEINEVRKKRGEEVRCAVETEEELSKFRKTKEILKKSGMGFEDYHELGSLIKNVKDKDCNPEDVVDFYKTSEDLEEHKTQLETRITELEEEEKNLMQENRTREEILQERQKMVESLRLLDRNNLNPEDIMVLAEAAVSASRSRGFPRTVHSAPQSIPAPSL